MMPLNGDGFNSGLSGLRIRRRKGCTDKVPSRKAATTQRASCCAFWVSLHLVITILAPFCVIVAPLRETTFAFGHFSLGVMDKAVLGKAATD
jgi:hypothetical protein